ncbi:MAG: hypothetical protein JSR82_13995 [Verrucomicrobia bacterium]|nr:hypothetical protein [Verrucomicrobiota bacterium]
MHRRLLWLALVLLAVTSLPAAPQDRVFYLAGDGSRQLLGVMVLSDGTVLAAGSSENLSWIPAGTPITVLSATAGNGAVLDNSTSATPRYAFLVQLSADLGQVLRVAHFPLGAANEIRWIKTDALPYGAPTGALFVSGSRGALANGSNAGYFIARLDANFVAAPPTGLAWVVNVTARSSSEYFELQPWDVQPDGKVILVAGKPYDSSWCEVIRLRAQPTEAAVDALANRDVVPGWRAHTMSDGTRFYGLLADYSGPLTASGSHLVMKVGGTNDAGLMRSFSPADYAAWERDENGWWRRGRWPMDAFWNREWLRPTTGANNTGGGDARGYGGSWYAVPTGDTWTSRVGAVTVDRRNGHCYLGVSHKSILPDGNPDFEPFVVGFRADGAMKWWARLYQEYADNSATPPASVDTTKVRVSTPDQYVDTLAVDYARPLAADGSDGALYVGARCHGNNTTNFWPGNQVTANPGATSYHNGFTGTNGNIHISWIGKLRDDATKSTLLAASYCAEFNEGASSFAAAYADPNLDKWPSHNGGNANLNTTRLRPVMWSHPDGGVAVLATGRRTLTTRNAFQRNVRPLLSGTVTTAESTTAFRANALVGVRLLVSAGCKLTLGGQTRTVLSHDDATGRITLDTALPSVPAAGATFTVNEGIGAWNTFARSFAPGLDTLAYSSLLTGAWSPADGTGGDNTEGRGLFPVPGGLLVCGYHKVSGTTATGNAMPTQNVPTWAASAPVNEAGFLARLNFAAPPAGFSAWIATQPGVPANQRGLADDPDGDGLPNFLEWSLGTDPAVPQSGAPPWSVARNTQTGRAELTFSRQARTDVRYELEESGDLVTWSLAWSSEGAQNTAGNVTASATTPTARFLRLRVRPVP